MDSGTNWQVSFFIFLNILWSGDTLSHQSLKFYTEYMEMGGGVCVCVCMCFSYSIGVATAVLFLPGFVGLLRVLGFDI